MRVYGKQCQVERLLAGSQAGQFLPGPVEQLLVLEAPERLVAWWDDAIFKRIFVIEYAVVAMVGKVQVASAENAWRADHQRLVIALCFQDVA